MNIKIILSFFVYKYKFLNIYKVIRTSHNNEKETLLPYTNKCRSSDRVVSKKTENASSS